MSQGERGAKYHSTRSFLTELSYNDLRRLRSVAKRTKMNKYRAEFVTDREADRIIEAVGFQVQESLIRAAVDAKMTDDTR